MMMPRCGVADIINGTRVDVVSPVAGAFQTWAANTYFRFSRIDNYRDTDITIGFQRRDHRDGNPFEDPGGTIAHAFAPTIGRFNYDADETWFVSARPGNMHLETIALHEIGHLLGLSHNSIENAIMYPSIVERTSKGLDRDDIE
ncbi:Peptidase M10 [Theobroma cacao]|nr:Peptidase M10 [Theobroma cacao]